MSLYKENDVLDTDSKDGIWLDFKDNTWVFFIKDQVWQDEEIARTKKSEVTISFIQKGISDAFLLEIFDCLEPSDIPFCVKEASEDMTATLHTKDAYKYEIVLVNEDDRICAVRDGRFVDGNSAILHKRLSARLSEDFKPEDTEASYAVLTQKYEPYELEQFAVFTQKN